MTGRFLSRRLLVFTGQMTVLLTLAAAGQPAKEIAVWDRVRSALVKGVEAPSERERQRALMKAYEGVRSLSPSPFRSFWERLLEECLFSDPSTAAGQVQRNRALSHLGRLIGMATGSGGRDAGRVRLVVTKVLASSVFHDRWAPVKRFWRRVWTWLAERLEGPSKWLESQWVRLWRFLGRLLMTLLKPFLWLFQYLLQISPTLTWILVGAVTGLIAFLLSLSVLRLLEARGRKAVVTEEGRSVETPEQLLKEAREKSNRGLYLDAVRLVYRAILLLLDRSQICEFRDEKTGREYLRDVMRVAPTGVREAFSEATFNMERCLYRNRSASAEDYHLMVAASSRLGDALLGVSR